MELLSRKAIEFSITRCRTSAPSSPMLTIRKASFFLLDEMAIICASWLKAMLVISVVRFISSLIGRGEAPAKRPSDTSIEVRTVELIWLASYTLTTPVVDLFGRRR